MIQKVIKQGRQWILHKEYITYICMWYTYIKCIWSHSQGISDNREQGENYFWRRKKWKKLKTILKKEKQRIQSRILIIVTMYEVGIIIIMKCLIYLLNVPKNERYIGEKWIRVLPFKIKAKICRGVCGAKCHVIIW